MADQQNSDHWDQLASVLGTEPTSQDTEHQPEPAPPKPVKAIKTSPSVTRDSKPAPKAANWDALANELGIPAAEREASPVAPPAKTPRKESFAKTSVADRNVAEEIRTVAKPVFGPEVSEPVKANVVEEEIVDDTDEADNDDGQIERAGSSGRGGGNARGASGKKTAASQKTPAKASHKGNGQH